MEWPRLPDWVVTATPPIPVAALERVGSLAALRCLIGLYGIVGVVKAADELFPTVQASYGDLRGYTGLARSSIQKGMRELEAAGVIASSPADSSLFQPRTYTLLPAVVQVKE